MPYNSTNTQKAKFLLRTKHLRNKHKAELMYAILLFSIHIRANKRILFGILLTDIQKSLKIVCATLENLYFATRHYMDMKYLFFEAG